MAKIDIIDELNLLEEGYVDICIHERCAEYGGGWLFDDSLSALPYGGAVRMYEDFNLRDDVMQIESDIVERLGKLNAAGDGFILLRVPVEWEDDWYEPNGPDAVGLVAKGGPWLCLDQAYLVDLEKDASTIEGRAVEEIRRLRMELANR